MGLFQNNVELTYLTLEDNQIKSLKSRTFNSLVKLNELYLYNNYIQSFPVDIFDNNPLTWTGSWKDKGSRKANFDEYIYKQN